MTVTKDRLLKVYNVTLPSMVGERVEGEPLETVTIRLPNMMVLLASPSVPGAIKKVAMDQAEKAAKSKGKISTEKAQKNSMSPEDYTAFIAYARYVVSRTMVDPEITQDDVDWMDDVDAQLVLAFAQRQIDPVQYQAQLESGEVPFEIMEEAVA